MATQYKNTIAKTYNGTKDTFPSSTVPVGVTFSTDGRLITLSGGTFEPNMQSAFVYNGSNEIRRLTSIATDGTTGTLDQAFTGSVAAGTQFRWVKPTEAAILGGSVVGGTVIIDGDPANDYQTGEFLNYAMTAGQGYGSNPCDPIIVDATSGKIRLILKTY